jgi:pSer/pThr/pTyr-binding forkhead associated (FHA) protein
MLDSLCGSCGYDNPLGANFCMSCGKKLARHLGERNTASLEPTLDSPPVQTPNDRAPVAMLVVRQGPKRGSRIALDGARTTIGRHPESDIFLDDITVSRRHAEILRGADFFEVCDVGSLNGTYVNQVLVERAPLGDGDEVQVGKFKLVFLALGDEAS